MVWKSPLRQHSRSSESEVSSSPSQPLLTSPAEIQVRDIASTIGLHEDSEILATVCHKMRKEYVVEEWQLPVLDSRQWERLHAPIGLAVAVRHMSAHPFREQRLQLPFRERPNDDDTQIFVAKGGEQKSLRIVEGKKNHSLALSYHKIEDTAKTPAFSHTKPSQGKEEQNIEMQRKTIFRGDLTGPGPDLDITEAISPSVFEAYTATTNKRIQGKTIETENLARANKQEEGDGRNNAPLASNDMKENNEFSEACTDWLELDPTNTKEEEQKSREEESKHVGMVTSISVINNNNGAGLDEENGDLRTTLTPGTTEETIETVNRKIIEQNTRGTKTGSESADCLEWEKQEEAQIGISVDVEVEGEGEAAEVEITTLKNAEACSDSKQLKTAKEEEAQLQKTPDGHKGDSVSIPIEIEGLLETDPGTAKREEPPETSSSDSESEGNTNIFSGIENSVSFSEDEDDSGPNDKEASKLGCLLDQLESVEDSAISSRDDTETNLLLIPEYGADDITVPISNVSPGCRKAASERKKRIRKYHHEYDRGKCTNVSTALDGTQIFI